MATDDATQRLASLVVDVLELGSGKFERDVADDLFRAFGIDLAELQERFPNAERKTGFPALAAEALAAAAPSIEALMGEVVRCGGRFVAMVEEIYTVLADHIATTAGANERFRLRRDAADLEITISPAFIERVRQLQSRLRQVTVGKVDHGSLIAFTGWDDGEFYGRWPLESDELRLLDAVLRTDALGEARPAAEKLVAAAEWLLEAHIENLAALTTDDVHALFANLHPFSEPGAARELKLFRAEGLLGDRASANHVTELEHNAFVGLARDGGVAIRPDHHTHVGSAVSGLAQFVAMWRAGMRPVRGEPSTPSDLRAACEEASEWLRTSVLIPAGTVDVEDLVEDFEEFMNLPLWRGRALLYEIWILCATLSTCREFGWHTSLRIDELSSGEWVLEARPTTEPVAYLRHDLDEELALEVWREPRRRTARGQLTPDVAIATPGDHPRDLVVIEAKDRYGMRVGRADKKRDALGVATQYRAALQPVATWVCNHCDFREDDADPSTNFGDVWSRVHLAAPFRPGSVPAAFAASLEAALTPPGGLPTSATDRLTLVVDVTASMSGHLPDAWQHLCALDEGRFAEFRAVLYSDHGQAEPFVTRRLGPHETLDALLREIDSQPTGDGNDFEEALEDAIRDCRQLAREQGKHTVLVLTDAPPHGADQCPFGISFDAEVDALLETGSPCLVCDDWRSASDDTWRRFAGRAGFSEAPLTDLIAALNG